MFYEEGKKNGESIIAIWSQSKFSIVYGYLPNEWLLIDRTFC